jgi:hypothetical protein
MMVERILLLILANFLFYFKTLQYKYSSDDIPVSQRPKDPNKLRHWFFVLEGRELTGNPKIDRSINLTIHALTCVFIYLGFGATDISFLGAFLFAFNPANNQSAVWISGKAYSWSALFTLIALTIPFLAPVFIFMATWFPAGFVLPSVLIGSPTPLIVLYVPFCWLARYARFKTNVIQKATMEMFVEDRKIGWYKLILAIKTFGYYTSHALIPTKTTFYHSFLQSAAGSGKEKAYNYKDRYFFIGLAAGMFIFLYMINNAWGPMSFYLLWWCVGIAPFLNFVRIHQEIAERYMYAPNAGLMMALATMIHADPGISAFFLGMYATKMWFYMEAFQDDYYLVEFACMNSRGSWFAWHSRAMKRWHAKSINEALIMWVMARKISPKEFKVNFNIATALAMMKKMPEALEFLQIAEENIPPGQEEQDKQLIADWRNGKVTVLM